MPDAAPAAAPAATANTSTPTTTTPNTPATTTTQPASPAAAKPEASKPAEWGDNDKSQLFELLKRSPYKLRMKGEEQAIDSEEALHAAIMDAQRGRGASKVVEEAKRERAEAQKAAEEAKRMASLVDAARKGDMRALAELGLEPPEARAQREALEQQIPPEVRALVQDNERMARELADLQRQSEEARVAQERAQQAKHIEAVRAEALETTKSIVEKLGVDPKHIDSVLPEVVQAMHDLGEQGMELGQDYSVDHLLKLVEQRRDAGGVNRLKQMAPAKAIAATADVWTGATPAQVRESLGDKFEGFVVGLARELKAMRSTAKPAAPAQPQTERPEAMQQRPRPGPTPLPVFRFQR